MSALAKVAVQAVPNLNQSHNFSRDVAARSFPRLGSGHGGCGCNED